MITVIKMALESTVTEGATITEESTIDVEEELQLLLSVGEECQTEKELKELLTFHKTKGGKFRLYDGFEPSGRMHIAQGVFKARNVNKCTRAGGIFVFWVADWFALMNDKMGGDLEKIQIVGQYLMEVWKAAGMILKDEEQGHDLVLFLWASEEITKNASTYWPQMIDIARRFNVTRVKKCCQIMGRMEGGLTAAQILYPLMQCTDVFFLNANICQLGVDQRKVNMLAREYCAFLSKQRRPPIILSHHMLYGLKEGQSKMSKSDADSAIFMEDSSQDVRRKILAAYCPISVTQSTVDLTTNDDEDDAGKSSMQLIKDDLKNPCLDYVKNIIFNDDPSCKSTFTAGGITYDAFAKVKEAFLSGQMSEMELKEGLIDELNSILEPVRFHFTHDERAKDLLAKVQQFKKEARSEDSINFRRLDLVALNAIPANCAVIFVPLPTATPSLQLAMDTIAQIVQAFSQSLPVVLFLSDWSARVQNACGADEKIIQSYYDVFLCCVRSLLAAEFQGKQVSIVRQSDCILKDPSNYWISVINVGRHFMLEEVMGDNMKDSDAVGHVIARMMRVADVLSMNPSTVFLSEGPNSPQHDVKVEQYLIEKYLSLPSVLKSFEKESPLSVQVIPPFASLMLQQRESEAHATENDEYFLLDDPKVHGKSKMKKAFCQPGNMEFCPVISILSAFLYHLKPFTVNGRESDPPSTDNNAITIHRTAENGGDVVFSTPAELISEFANGSLHPGDIKAAASILIVSILEQLSNSIKNDCEASKGAKALKAYEKKKQKPRK